MPLEFQILGRKSKNDNNSYDSNNSNDNDIFSCIEKINNEYQKKNVDETTDNKNKNNGNNGNNFYCLHL